VRGDWRLAIVVLAGAVEEQKSDAVKAAVIAVTVRQSGFERVNETLIREKSLLSGHVYTDQRTHLPHVPSS
jgi:hypothetical protein